MINATPIASTASRPGQPMRAIAEALLATLSAPK